MTASPSQRVVFRDYPVGVWFTGMIALGVAMVAFITDEAWQAFVVSLIGIVIVAFGSILTVTVDEMRGILYLNYRSLVRASTKAYPFSDIAFVKVAEDWEGERMYRLELVLYSGETVPLRTGYLIGRRIQERKAQRIRSALGIDSDVPYKLRS